MNLRNRVERLEQRQGPDGSRVILMSIFGEDRVVVTADGQCREVPDHWEPPSDKFKIFVGVSPKDDN
jgi:hypothetical protein